MGRGLGLIFYRIGSKRQHVARTNLKLCFPEKSEQEIEFLLKENFKNTGIALFETGMGWWWPDWRVRKHATIEGVEHLEKAHAEGKGVLMIAMHYLSVEINCRSIGFGHPMVVFYRPHNNQLMEYFQFRGRGRSNKYMLGKRDVKGLIKALRDGEVCVYLPDQDYGRNKSMFVPFFAVPDAATTMGTLIFARQPDIETVMVTPTRNDDDSGYTLTISPPFKDFPTGDDEQDLIRINQELEKAISYKPEQYMWLHRRFKTRPDADAPSVYK
ncbi:KDO2-lipid IV(A) lauroyltransferase [Thalassotalea agarivorans]|uniref:Lipid A biosynthesis acyltransferase n=2 Tax=Thalassotalea agarivorans TaxID=349064 RepID=A0A1I0HV43_THASX|nr:KDO2-lipid IV(A) lauroyltransferase [Thalassotalea agarivorans]